VVHEPRLEPLHAEPSVDVELVNQKARDAHHPRLPVCTLRHGRRADLSPHTRARMYPSSFAWMNSKGAMFGSVGCPSSMPTRVRWNTRCGGWSSVASTLRLYHCTPYVSCRAC
jgi:hypothetical protein